VHSDDEGLLMKVVRSHLALGAVVDVIGIAMLVIIGSVVMQIVTASRVLSSPVTGAVFCLSLVRVHV
jgi:hypothetical protein